MPIELKNDNLIYNRNIFRFYIKLNGELKEIKTAYLKKDGLIKKIYSPYVSVPPIIDYPYADSQAAMHVGPTTSQIWLNEYLIGSDNKITEFKHVKNSSFSVAYHERYGRAKEVINSQGVLTLVEDLYEVYVYIKADYLPVNITSSKVKITYPNDVFNTNKINYSSHSINGDMARIVYGSYINSIPTTSEPNILGFTKYKYKHTSIANLYY